MSTYHYLSYVNTPDNQVLKRECGGRELSNDSNTPQRTMYRNAQRDMKDICNDAKATTCEAIKDDPKLTLEEQYQRIEETQRKLGECVRRRKEMSNTCFIPPNQITGFKRADPHGYDEMVKKKRGHDEQMSVVVTRRSDCRKLDQGLRTKQDARANRTNRRKTQSNTDSQRQSKMNEQHKEQVENIQRDIDELHDVDERAAEQITLEYRVNSIQSRINDLPKLYHHKLNANLSRKNRQLNHHINSVSNNIVFQHQTSTQNKRQTNNKSQKRGKGVRPRNTARRAKARQSRRQKRSRRQKN